MGYHDDNKYNGDDNHSSANNNDNNKENTSNKKDWHRNGSRKLKTEIDQGKKNCKKYFYK